MTDQATYDPTPAEGVLSEQIVVTSIAVPQRPYGDRYYEYRIKFTSYNWRGEDPSPRGEGEWVGQQTSDEINAEHRAECVRMALAIVAGDMPLRAQRKIEAFSDNFLPYVDVAEYVGDGEVRIVVVYPSTE
jgi:hypothetical protein